MNKARGVKDNLKVIVPILAVLLSLGLGAIIIKLIGVQPLVAYKAMYQGSLANTNAIAETLVKVTPLILTGLSYAIAYKAGLVNIGAAGQLYMGGFTATAVGVYINNLPLIIHLPIAIIAGFLGGGVWGLIVGWLKVKYDANEIITTVMLNYIAMNWISYLVTGPMKAPPGNFPQSKTVVKNAQLPIIISGTRLHLGLIISLLALAFYFIFLWKMKKGYEIRVSGKNIHAARYAGMDPQKSILLVMFIAGGMGGLAGATEILGIQERLLQGFSPGYGFDGIAVALVGMLRPVGIFFGALLFGVLRSGGNMMQMLANVPVSIVNIIQGLVIIFVIAGQVIRFNTISEIKGKLLNIKDGILGGESQ